MREVVRESHFVLPHDSGSGSAEALAAPHLSRRLFKRYAARVTASLTVLKIHLGEIPGRLEFATLALLGYGDV